MKKLLMSALLFTMTIVATAQDRYSIAIDGAHATPNALSPDGNVIEGETYFDLYLPKVSANKMASLISTTVSAKENTEIVVKGKNMSVVYDPKSKIYVFDGQEFTAVTEVRKAVRKMILEVYGLDASDEKDTNLKKS